MADRGHAGHGDVGVVRHRRRPGLGGHTGPDQRVADHDQVDPLPPAVAPRLDHEGSGDQCAGTVLALVVFGDGGAFEDNLVPVGTGQTLQLAGHEAVHPDRVPVGVLGPGDLHLGELDRRQDIAGIPVRRVRDEPDVVVRHGLGRRRSFRAGGDGAVVRGGLVPPAPERVPPASAQDHEDDQEHLGEEPEPAEESSAGLVLGRIGRGRWGCGVGHIITSWRYGAHEGAIALRTQGNPKYTATGETNKKPPNCQCGAVFYMCTFRP
jgi:hypothetical protein